MSKTRQTTTSLHCPYRAVICGEEHIVKGWQRGNLHTDKGEFVIRRFQGDKVESEWMGEIGRVPPSFPIESGRILEVAVLESDGNGRWLLNGCHMAPLQWASAGARLLPITNSEVLRVHKGEIRAVAWVQTFCDGTTNLQLDTVMANWKSEPLEALSTFCIDSLRKGAALFAGWSRPIWLAEFHKVGSSKKSWMEGLGKKLKQLASPTIATVSARKHKAAKKGRSELVARFEQDYAIAVIPQKKKNDLNLSLEPQLRALVKEIIDAGGKLSRKNATRQLITKLGKTNSENYQPEKLLRSKTAKALINAGLLGKDKSSRNSTFWAKEHAV